MHRYRVPLVLAALFSVALLPHSVFAAGDFFGPIIGADIQACPGPAGWGGLVETVNNLIKFALSLGIIIAVLMAAYAGFLWITNPINPENRSAARTILINSAIGLVLALSAWLIVNTVLIALTGGNVSNGSGGSGVSHFTGFLSGGDVCIKTTTQTPLANGSTAGTTGTPTTGAGTDNSPNTRGDCTPSGLQANGMDSSIASAMSCITKSEDTSCALGAKSGTDIGSDGNSVSIGMFQINISANDLSKYPACEAAVGNAPLNCTQAFTGGAYTASNHNTSVSDSGQRLYSTCVQAASNPQCNVQAAQDQYNNKGGIGNWGTAAQNACG